MTDAGGVNRTVVLEEQLKTVIRLHAGETKRTAYTIAHEAEVILEHEEQIKATLSTQYDTKASAAAAVKLEMASQLKWALESSLRQRYQTRRLDRTEEVVEETHSLPAEVAGSGPQVSARHLQKAPVYERIRVIARTTCECCGIQQYDSYIVLVPTGEYQTRQVDYLDDNTTRTTLTG